MIGPEGMAAQGIGLEPRWGHVKLKYLLKSVGSGGTPSTDVPSFWAEDGEDGFPWVAIADMSRTSIVSTTAKRVTPEGLKCKGLAVWPSGTLLMSMYASLGHVATLGVPAATNQAILALHPRNDVDPGYLRYWLTAIQPLLKGEANSNTQDNLNAEKVANLPATKPPFEEQRRIAAFLDHETARIDELRQHTKTTIELLLERRATILYRAVSGELTHNDFAPSRAPWLERRARGWSDAQVRRVAALGTGHTPSRSNPEYWEECSIPWVTTGEVARLRDDRVEYLHETREKISEFGLANSAAVLHPKGTVFLSRTASVGFSGIMGTNMATSQDFVTWTCGPRLRPRFLLLCLRAMRPYLLGHLAMGSTHKTIYMPDIESLTIPLPPVEEQDRIVGLTWDLLREIDEGIDALKEHSALLSERRSALIAAAVTGQLDISDWRARSDTVLEGVA